MKIGELAERSAMTPSAIRFYEQSGLLPQPQRGANGYRIYGDNAVERLRLIQIAQKLGFSLDSIRSGFNGDEVLTQDELLEKLSSRLVEINRLMATLRAQRQDLLALRATLGESWAAGECVNIETLAKGLTVFSGTA